MASDIPPGHEGVHQEVRQGLTELGSQYTSLFPVIQEILGLRVDEAPSIAFDARSAGDSGCGPRWSRKS